MVLVDFNKILIILGKSQITKMFRNRVKKKNLRDELENHEEKKSTPKKVIISEIKKTFYQRH